MHANGASWTLHFSFMLLRYIFPEMGNGWQRCQQTADRKGGGTCWEGWACCVRCASCMLARSACCRSTTSCRPSATCTLAQTPHQPLVTPNQADTGTALPLVSPWQEPVLLHGSSCDMHLLGRLVTSHPSTLPRMQMQAQACRSQLETEITW